MSAKKKTTSDWGAALHEIHAREHTKTVTEAKSEKEKLLGIIAEQDRQLEVALGLADAKPRKGLAMKLSSGDKNESVAFAIASDWHVEETVDPKTVNGLNEFTLAIAEQRIERFFRRVVRITEIQRAGTKIDTLVLGLLGDLMTGYIHEELRESNGLSPTETVLWLSDRVGAGLQLLEKHFGRLVIPCNYGNHGRNTIKPRHATGAKNSYEWMFYHLMRKQFPQFDWRISDSYHNYIEVDGRVVRLHHACRSRRVRPLAPVAAEPEVDQQCQPNWS